MAFEGLVAIQHQSQLAIFNTGGAYHELKKGDRIEVDTGEHGLEMEIKRDDGGVKFALRISGNIQWIFQLFGGASDCVLSETGGCEGGRRIPHPLAPSPASGEGELGLLVGRIIYVKRRVIKNAC